MREMTLDYSFPDKTAQTIRRVRGTSKEVLSGPPVGSDICYGATGGHLYFRWEILVDTAK